MELKNIETGATWKGDPVDAKELLARGGWQKIEEPKSETGDPTSEVSDQPRRRGRPRK